jgi:hypothetical protein
MLNVQNSGCDYDILIHIYKVLWSYLHPLPNTTPFYISVLSICGFLYPRSVLETTPVDIEGKLCLIIILKSRTIHVGNMKNFPLLMLSQLILSPVSFPFLGLEQYSRVTTSPSLSIRAAGMHTTLCGQVFPPICLQDSILQTHQGWPSHQVVLFACAGKNINYVVSCSWNK